MNWQVVRFPESPLSGALDETCWFKISLLLLLKMRKNAISLVLLLISLGGCKPTALNPAAVEQTSPTSPAALATWTPVPLSPTLIPEPVASATPHLVDPIPNSAGLTIEENELVGQVQLEPLKFQPVQGTQADVLERHAKERQGKNLPSRLVYDPRGPEIEWGTEATGYRVSEVIEPNPSGERIRIQVERGGQVIFETDAGEASPLTAFQRFWADEEHWFLEVNRVTNRRKGNSIYSEALGQIYRDGVLLNEQYGYDEMFHFQRIDDKPFYFYRKGDSIYASYDGQTLPLEYDRIPHYGCCSASVLNPVGGNNWVGFFAQRDDTWVYTEIGAYP